jgi:hypothetical protein
VNRIGAFGSGKFASYTTVSIASTAIVPECILAPKSVPLHDPSSSILSTEYNCSLLL